MTTEPVALDDLAGTIDAYRRFRAEADRWTSAAAELRRVIEARLADADVGTIAGRPVVRHTSYTERRVDMQKLRLLSPANLVEQCTATTTRRRFSLVEGEAIE
ncbi:hypothetical protein [Longispora albida]|uniref:hypothetical protein n=1 Tax=Longispora albida TaxID=203523 RepID=UPI000371E2AB|nr:hypothetical protein [Longispora albida]